MSLETSAGFLRRKKCSEMAGSLLVDQDDGAPEVDGVGGLGAGNFTGMGFAGGVLFFLVSCCPASKLPM